MSQTVKDSYLDDHMLGDGVEFVGIISRNGRLVDSKGDGFKLSDEQKEMFFMSYCLEQKMHHDYDDNFGNVRYTITERENHRIITVPQESETVIFIMDKKSEFSARVKKLMRAIQHYKDTQFMENR